MQAIVENGKVIANGVAYLVPSVKDGTKVVLTLNAYSSKFCLVNYKDKKGITRSEKAIAEFMMPDNAMQNTAVGRVSATGKSSSNPAKKRLARMTRNYSGEMAALLQKFEINEFCRISQETYNEIVKQLQLGMTINCSAKSIGLVRATIIRYRGMYSRALAGGYKLLLAANGTTSLKKIEVLNEE